MQDLSVTTAPSLPLGTPPRLGGGGDFASLLLLAETSLSDVPAPEMIGVDTMPLPGGGVTAFGGPDPVPVGLPAGPWASRPEDTAPPPPTGGPVNGAEPMDAPVLLALPPSEPVSIDVALTPPATMPGGPPVGVALGKKDDDPDRDEPDSAERETADPAACGGGIAVAAFVPPMVPGTAPPPTAAPNPTIARAVEAPIDPGQPSPPARPDSLEQPEPDRAPPGAATSFLTTAPQAAEPSVDPAALPSGTGAAAPAPQASPTAPVPQAGLTAPATDRPAGLTPAPIRAETAAQPFEGALRDSAPLRAPPPPNAETTAMILGQDADRGVPALDPPAAPAEASAPEAAANPAASRAFPDPANDDHGQQHRAPQGSRIEPALGPSRDTSFPVTEATANAPPVLEAPAQGGEPAPSAAPPTQASPTQAPAAASSTEPASAPDAPAPSRLAEQIAPAIIRLDSAPGGTQRLTIRLDPVELGQLEIRIERSDDAATKVQVLVERPETLALLRRDQPALERALDQAGMAADQRDVILQLAPVELRPTPEPRPTPQPSPDFMAQTGNQGGNNPAGDDPGRTPRQPTGRGQSGGTGPDPAPRCGTAPAGRPPHGPRHHRLKGDAAWQSPPPRPRPRQAPRPPHPPRPSPRPPSVAPRSAPCRRTSMASSSC